MAYDHATEQQCKENLRNNTSGQGNPSESVQVYHTLSKDLKVNQSVSPEKSLPPETHERVLSEVYYALKKKEELNSTASLNDTTTELYVNSARDGK